MNEHSALSNRTPPRPALPARDPQRELLQGLVGGFAIGLVVCLGAIASTTWLAG